jgi:MraZ protein
MLTRKTQYAWMSLGGMICLFALVLACKLRDGNRAIAQPELPPSTKKGPSPSLFTLPPTLGQEKTKEPEKLSPPKKPEKSKEPVQEKRSEPKATLERPMPSESAPPLLPTAFGPHTPTPPGAKGEPPTAAKGEPPTALPPASALHFPPTPPSSLTPKIPEKKSETTTPSWNAPASVVPASTIPAADHDSARTQPGEPPLAPAPGPVQLYHVHGKETLRDIARRTLGSSDRWTDLHKLNPTLHPEEPLRAGATVRLPADACVQADDVEPVKPLPVLQPKPPAPKAKVLPLTGTYQCSLDEKGRLTLPRAIRDQLSGSNTVLLSPGPDKCLWLTNPPHLERLGERLDQAQVNEADVRVFKRLYFAQTEKLTINDDGRITVPERLSQFAGLRQEVVLVGIDDHFEIWDATRWRTYTQQKSAGHSAAMAESE